jgi:antirestriction protein ArdC
VRKHGNTTADNAASVTANIIEKLEQGIVPWVRPWKVTGISDMPTNFATKRRYNGANILNLWMAQAANGYATAEWLTYKQAAGLGGQVRKGETGTPVFYASAFEVDAKNAKGEDTTKTVPFPQMLHGL